MSRKHDHTTQTLGQFLQDARHGAGLSLEEIARTTRVGLRYLRALEGDSFGDLPADVYVRGYLRAYAREVGLDVEEVLSRYRAARGDVEEAPVLRLPGKVAPPSRGEAADEAAPALASDDMPVLAAAAPSPARRRALGSGTPRPPRRLSFAILLLLLFVAAVTISVIYYVNQPSERGGEPRGPTTTETATFDVAG